MGGVEELGAPEVHVPAATLVEFFEQVAACPREGAGAWIFEHGSERLGVLLIENGAVCWSTLPGRRKRFLAILEAASGAKREQLDAVLRACVNDKVSIVEGMTRAGVMTLAQLVVALRRDTVESMLEIAGTPDRRGVWHPHRGVGYSAPVKFSLVELLLDAMSLVLGAPHAELTATGDALVGGESLYLFMNTEGLPVVGSTSARALSVPDCLQLAQRAIILAHSSTSSIFAAKSPDSPGGATVTWREGPWLGVLETRGAPHHVLRKLIGREAKST